MARRVGRNMDGHHSVHIGAVPDFKPFRDRPVKAREIPCPQCGAPAGEFCVSETGQSRLNTHPSRRRMALRRGL